jgi:hypothetical protein
MLIMKNEDIVCNICCEDVSLTIDHLIEIKGKNFIQF